MFVVATITGERRVAAVFKTEAVASRYGFCELGDGQFAVSPVDALGIKELHLGPLVHGHYGVGEGLRALFRSERTLTRTELQLFLQCKQPTIACNLTALRKLSPSLRVHYAHGNYTNVWNEPPATPGAVG